jgi:acyl-coenzyme A thioesterase PaaI-like protein
MSQTESGLGDAFQDFYPDDVAVCYGCGRLNEAGLQIKSRWEGEEAVCEFTPRSYHTAVRGYVYGGLIASLVDCHCTGTASAATARAEGRPLGSAPVPRFVTASLKVDYLKPTPLGPSLELRAQVKEITSRKVIVACAVYADGVQTARGEVVAVQMPADLLPPGEAPS